MNHYPLFAALKNRPVLVVGAGTVAERKVESLLQARAEVRVVAPKLNARFQNWLHEERIEYLGTLFSEQYLDDVYFVIAASGDSALNERVFKAAEARRKLCNTVDTADLCSFVVPAVVDRNPIQIAISSGGTSPVLARKWRLAIETLIPRHTGKMAAIAGKWRERVKSALQDSRKCRLFWEKLFAGRFDTLCAQNHIWEAENELSRQLNGFAAPQGEVALVGAGPGDPGLLTLNALNAIQSADTVFYDSLVSDGILALIRKDAEKISVGKRAGSHHVQQEETNRLLVEYAQQGKRVVRLKGGDPFVFGRGGEEAQILKQEGIPYRIVPGITAALGATAYAGIPLTHRNLAQSALFVTGHCKRDGEEPDWRTLAMSRQTLVVYMGTLHASEISGKLIRHGLNPNTPVAIISNGTLPEQSVRTGMLHNLPMLAADAPRPALIVIGEVVRLRNELQWFQTHIEQMLQPAAQAA